MILWSKNTHGISWMIIHCFLMSICTYATQQISNELNPYMVSSLVYIFAFLLCGSWIIINRETLPKTKRIKTYLVRGITGIASYVLFAYGLTHMTMAEVSAIVFTSPLFGTLLAVLYFKEQLTLPRALALAVGFVGAMIVIQPGSIDFNHASIAVLISAFLYAIVHLSIKSLTETESHKTILYYTQFVMFVMSLPFLFLYWQTPTSHQILWSVLIAITWIGAILSLSQSYKSAPAIVVMPFQFMRLVFVVILGVFLLDETVNSLTIIGSAIILAGATYAARYEIRSHNA